MLRESEVSRFHLYILRFTRGRSLERKTRIRFTIILLRHIIIEIICIYIQFHFDFTNDRKKKKIEQQEAWENRHRSKDRQIGGDNDRSDQWVTLDEHDKKRSKAGKP